MTKRREIVHPGRFYGRRSPTGPLEPAPADSVPDEVVCRRLRDFGPGQIPPSGAITACARCGAAVVYNPAGRFLEKPKVCMQCCRIEPLPITRQP